MKPKIALAKSVTLIVALQILNISIYAQDINMQQQKGFITYINDINSIAEYVGEVILKHPDAFPEYPKDGHKELQFSKHFDLTPSSIQKLKVQTNNTNAFSKYVFPHKEDYSFLFFREINPPPPKV